MQVDLSIDPVVTARQHRSVEHRSGLVTRVDRAVALRFRRHVAVAHHVLFAEHVVDSSEGLSRLSVDTDSAVLRTHPLDHRAEVALGDVPVSHRLLGIEDEHVDVGIRQRVLLEFEHPVVRTEECRRDRDSTTGRHDSHLELFPRLAVDLLIDEDVVDRRRLDTLSSALDGQDFQGRQIKVNIAKSREEGPVAIYDVSDDPRLQYPEEAKKEGIASILPQRLSIWS